METINNQASQPAVQSGTDKRSGFIEVNPDGTQSLATPEELMRVCEIRIRFNNGLVMSLS